MVELRKRPSRDQPPAQPAAKRGSSASGKMKKAVDKAKEVVGAGEFCPSRLFRSLFCVVYLPMPGLGLSSIVDGRSHGGSSIRGLLPILERV